VTPNFAAVPWVERYLAKAFGDHLAEMRVAMEPLASRYEPAEVNRIGFRLYEKFRPEVPAGNEGWARRPCWKSKRYWRPRKRGFRHRRLERVGV
jgi:anti-sigma-K factor RskA